MTGDWYAACLHEARAFLDQFAEQDEVTVSVDNEIIDALRGLMDAANWTYVAAQHVAGAAQALSMLEN